MFTVNFHIFEAMDVFKPSSRTSNVAIFTNLSGNSPNFLSRGLDLIQFIPFLQRHRRRFQYNVNPPTFLSTFEYYEGILLQEKHNKKLLWGKYLFLCPRILFPSCFTMTAVHCGSTSLTDSGTNGLEERKRSCPVALDFGITPVSELHKAM